MKKVLKQITSLFYNNKCKSIKKKLIAKKIFAKSFLIILILLILLIEKIVLKIKLIISQYQNETSNILLDEEEKDTKFYTNYIDDCNNLKLYKRIKIKNEIPFLSVCLTAHNMEKYIERAILSIINQSFQDFEIIIINDFSTDKTANILAKYNYNDKIKIINHSKNLGAYASLVDATNNSQGKFLILMDSDDMLIDPDLLYLLYNYSLKYNLDIIEFKKIRYIEKTKKLVKQKNNNHYHNFSKTIIYQPELSDLFFYEPRTKKYSKIICGPVWNKIIRKEILLKTFNYIGDYYYKEFILNGHDTLINLVNNQFANNYSNINFFGYMYNLREKSSSHNFEKKEKFIQFCNNYFLFNKKLYTFIKDFNKDRYFLFYELKENNDLLLKLRKMDKSKKSDINNFYEQIYADREISNIFKKYIKNFIL